MEVWSPLSYRPRSSLPVEVLAWLADRLAHLLPSRPPGKGGTPPLSLEVRLDAVAAVLLDGLSYRRAARMVGISKTEVGDSLDDLGQWLAEMARCGEAVCVDGLATRVQRPRGWGNQQGAVRRQAPHPHRPGRVGEHDLGRPVVGGRRRAPRSAA